MGRIEHYGWNKIVLLGQKTLLFIGFVCKRFSTNDGFYRAAALTFSSLLAIVPLMFVSFSLLSAYPAFYKANTIIQNFIFENFVPATGKVIQAHLQDFMTHASSLSITGLLFLFVTAILVMYTIEDSLNHIWRVRLRRRGLSAFLMYWAVLTLTPVLLGLSIAASTFVLSLQWFTSQPFDTVQSYGLAGLPYGLGVSLFTLLYLVVPNCKVAFRHALFGAVFAGTVVQILKALFIIYVTTFDTYELLYGAFAIVPLFFLWIYYVWLIVLLGAEVAHAFSAGYDRRMSEKIDGFTHAIRWLHRLWQAQLLGQALSYAELISADPYGYQIDPDDVLACLIERKFVRQTRDGHYLLARDLSQLTLGECCELLPWKWPMPGRFVSQQGVVEQALYQHLAQVVTLGEAVFALPMTKVFPPN